MSLTFSTWLKDKDSPAVARLSRLISATTNLSMETAEPLQVNVSSFMMSIECMLFIDLDWELWHWWSL